MQMNGKEGQRATNKAVIYCRISTLQQEKKGDGLRSQEAQCREYAERVGYEVEAVFDDKITASTNDRRGLEALLAHVKKRQAEGRVVLIANLNRFSRDVKNYWDLREALDAVGGVLASPHMSFENSPGGILMQNILMSAAQFQRQDNALQTLQRMRGRLLNGFWPFIPPRAMRNEKVPGRGKILVRIEPEASVLAEGLEAFAAGRIQTQADFARWLDVHPEFDNGRRKRVTDQQAHDILTNLLYAGYVERPQWGIERRKGQHDGLVSYETFERIQARLKGTAYAPARPDVSSDFPLRGTIACGCCGKPMTASWSKSKTGQKHPYYMCFAKDCERYRKSLRRDKVEGDFVELLEGMTPRPELLVLAKAMFRNAWEQRSEQAKAIAKSYERKIDELERAISAALDSIVEVTTASVIARFEQRINDLEKQKLILEEKRQNAGKPQGSFDELFELAFAFLSSPSKLWASGKIECQKLVLKLGFASHLEYCPEMGFRTQKKSLPFNMLGGL